MKLKKLFMCLNSYLSNYEMKNKRNYVHLKQNIVFFLTLSMKMLFKAKYNVIFTKTFFFYARLLF